MKPSWSRATADQKKGPEGDGVLKSSVKAAATPKRNVTGPGGTDYATVFREFPGRAGRAGCSCTSRHMRQLSPRNPQMIIFHDKWWYVILGTVRRSSGSPVAPDRGGAPGRDRARRPGCADRPQIAG